MANVQKHYCAHAQLLFVSVGKRTSWWFCPNGWELSCSLLSSMVSQVCCLRRLPYGKAVHVYCIVLSVHVYYIKCAFLFLSLNQLGLTLFCQVLHFWYKAEVLEGTAEWDSAFSQESFGRTDSREFEFCVFLCLILGTGQLSERLLEPVIYGQCFIKAFES